MNNLPADSTLSPELAAAVARVVAREHATIFAEGVASVVHKGFDEGKHPRDHGKFASAPGAKGDDKSASKPKREPLTDDQRDALRALMEHFPDGIGHLLTETGHVNRDHAFPEEAGHREAIEAHRQTWRTTDEQIQSLLAKDEEVTAKAAADDLFNDEINERMPAHDSFDPDAYEDDPDVQGALEEVRDAVYELESGSLPEHADGFDHDDYAIDEDDAMPDDDGPDTLEERAELASDAVEEHAGRLKELRGAVDEHATDVTKRSAEWRAEVRGNLEVVRDKAAAALAFGPARYQADDAYGDGTGAGIHDHDVIEKIHTFARELLEHLGGGDKPPVAKSLFAALQSRYGDPLAALFAGVGEIVTKAGKHSPAGGVEIGGQHYPGGQFIPADVIKNATKAEKKELKDKTAAAHADNPTDHKGKLAKAEVARQAHADAVGAGHSSERVDWLHERASKAEKEAGIEKEEEKPKVAPLISNETLFRLTGHQFTGLQQELGIAKPKMGPEGADAVRAALSNRAGGRAIAALLALPSDDFWDNGYPKTVGDAERGALDGKFTADELLDAAKWASKSDGWHSDRFLYGSIKSARTVDGVTVNPSAFAYMQNAAKVENMTANVGSKESAAALLAQAKEMTDKAHVLANAPAQPATVTDPTPETPGDNAASPPSSRAVAGTVNLDGTHKLASTLHTLTGARKQAALSKLADRLQGHTAGELRELKTRLGIRASGTKAELAKKLAERAANPDKSSLRHYAPAGGRLTVDAAHAMITGHLNSGRMGDVKVRREIADAIESRMSVKDLRELKTRLGLKASGEKYQLAQKITDRAKAKPPESYPRHSLFSAARRRAIAEAGVLPTDAEDAGVRVPQAASALEVDPEAVNAPTGASGAPAVADTTAMQTAPKGIDFATATPDEIDAHMDGFKHDSTEPPHVQGAKSKAYGDALRSMPQPVASAYIARKQAADRFARRSRAGTKGAKTRTRNAEADAKTRATPTGQRVLEAQEAIENLGRRYQVGGNVDNGQFERAQRELGNASLAHNLHLAHTEPDVVMQTRNRDLPSLNVESGPAPVEGTRGMNTMPWTVRHMPDSTPEVISGARVEDVGTSGERVLRLYGIKPGAMSGDSQTASHGNELGTLLAHFQGGDPSQSARARRLVREITAGKAQHMTVGQIQHLILTGEHLDPEAALSASYAREATKFPRGATNLPVEATNGKPSHELTREEHAKRWHALDQKAAHEPGGKARTWDDEIATAVANGDTADNARKWLTDMKAGGHEGEVRAALAAGKPVPDHVLADYPDLAPTLPATPSARGLHTLPAPALASEPVAAYSSPLHELAAHAHDPAALTAHANALRDLANKLPSAGGSLAFHDAVSAAMRGEHGEAIRDAVNAATDDWKSHGGDTAKRYARVAQEVAKVTGGSVPVSAIAPQPARSSFASATSPALAGAPSGGAVSGGWMPGASTGRRDSTPAQPSADAVPMQTAPAPTAPVHSATVVTKEVDGKKEKVVSWPFHNDTWNGIRNGTMAASDLKERFAALTADPAATKAHIAEQLKKTGLRSPEKIERSAAEIYDRALGTHVPGQSISYHMPVGQGLAAMDAAKLGAYKRASDNLTDEHVQATRAQHQAAKAERAERRSAIEQAISDPKTHEEFQTFARVKGEAALSPEQRAKWDHLQATARRTKDAASRAERATVTGFAPGAEATGGVGVVEGHHQKRNAPTFTVTVENRLGDEKFGSALERAKQLGGSYVNANIAKRYGATAGFQFFDKNKADQFAAVLRGESIDRTDDLRQTDAERLANRAASLSERADGLVEGGEESLARDRLANTARRAGMAASAEATARAQIATGRTLASISSAMAEGKLEHLHQTRNATDVDTLNRVLNNARYDRVREMQKRDGGLSQHEYDNEHAKPHSEDDVNAVKYPHPVMWSSDLKQAANALKDEPGLMRVAKKLADTATEKPKFKTQAGGLKVNGGQLLTPEAIASERPELAAALKNTGNHPGDKAVRVHTSYDWRLAQQGKGNGPFYTADGGKSWGTSPMIAVVASHNGGHDLDLVDRPQDKLLTIDHPDDIESMRKVASRLRNHPNRDLKRIGESFADRLEHHNRLQRMDIKSAPELRAALREYLPLKQSADKEDPVKKLERGLIGRKIPGFFPTPRQHIDEMLDRADIQPGHSVLEPSAGKGDILDAVRERHPDATSHAVEPVGDLRSILAAKGHNVVGSDFLSHSGQYDRVVMNPPFENGQDIDHVRHAYEQLKPGGKLVGIMSAGAFSRGDGKATDFRDWLDSVGGEHEEMPEGSFAGPDAFRQTGVRTHMVTVEKSATSPALAVGTSTASKPAVDVPTADHATAGHALYERLTADRALSVADATAGFRAIEALPKEAIAEICRRAGYGSSAGDSKPKMLKRLRKNLEGIKLDQSRADRIIGAPANVPTAGALAHTGDWSEPEQKQTNVGNGIDKPTSVGNTAPVPATSAGGANGGGAMHASARVKTKAEIGRPSRENPDLPLAQLHRQHDVLGELVARSGLPLVDLTDFTEGSKVFAHDPERGAVVEVDAIRGARIPNSNYGGKDTLAQYTPEEKQRLQSLVSEINSQLPTAGILGGFSPEEAANLRSAGYRNQSPTVVDWSVPTPSPATPAGGANGGGKVEVAKLNAKDAAELVRLVSAAPHREVNGSYDADVSHTADTLDRLEEGTASAADLRTVEEMYRHRARATAARTNSGLPPKQRANGGASPENFPEWKTADRLAALIAQMGG